MEVNCPRCQHTLTPESNYCASCGLPQLVYSSEETPGPVSQESWNEAPTDAGEIAWKPALQSAMMLAIPAGLICSAISPVGFFRLIWMSAAAAWVVILYIRRVEPAWITAGAGARIGLVTGLLSGWVSLVISGVAIFLERYIFHHGNELDAQWKLSVEQSQQMTAQFSSQLGAGNAQRAAETQAWMLSAGGHAALELFGLLVLLGALLAFSMLGGVIGARLSSRTRDAGD